MHATPGDPWIRRLLDVGRALTTELDQGKVLERVLKTAREVTGARYAALGVLNEEGDGLERFLTSGIDDAARRAIGEEPHGRGVLGELIEYPTPLRLANVGEHPRSYGFPPGHPPMVSFLGVPIVIRGRAWGNLYLTEKEGGEFTESDEESAVILADWAAIAIENARLYETSELRRREIEQAFRELEATQDVAEAIGGELSPQRLLELIVKRGRALVDARTLVVMLRDGDELVVETAAGHLGAATGVRLPMSGSAYGDVLEQRRSELVPDISARIRTPTREFGLDDPQTALLVPMIHRGEPLGVLAAFDRGERREAFTARDERMLQAFAANAATAVALARSVESARLRTSLAAAEFERRRWARELHDETLQGLGALRVLLSAALQREDPEQNRRTMLEAIEHIEREIANLRALISELRPAALDELGLSAALEALLDRHREHPETAIVAQLEFAQNADERGRLDSELETAVYRVVQEALTNIAKHAHARNVHVSIARAQGQVLVEVRDDGTGFDADARTDGFGLTGMRERVSQAGGALAITSSERGTRVSASMPVAGAAAGGMRSVPS